MRYLQHVRDIGARLSAQVEIEIGPQRRALMPAHPVAGLPPGAVVGTGGYAVGNIGGELFAVSRRCRHLGADLANGTIDEEGRLVCPWHRSAYDVRTGRMLRGPQGVFAKVPGLGAAYRALTRVLPLRRSQVLGRNGRVFVR